MRQELSKLGHDSIRLDTDRYPQDIALSTRYAGAARRRTLAGRDLSQCTAVWYRRFRAGEQLRLKEHLESAVRESRMTLWGSIEALPCRHVDRWQAVRVAELKEVQTEWALEAGLDLPRTLFSNDPLEVKRFYRELEGRMVTKMQTPVGHGRVMYSSRVREEDLAALDGLRSSPMIFQELVDKQLDIRVVVVGERLFGAAVDPQGELDWRKEGETLHRHWVPWDVPESVVVPLRKLMRRLDLSYGAVDFMLAGDRCLFLEVNAVGEWLWLEEQAGLPIAAALAHLLASQ